MRWLGAHAWGRGRCLLDCSQGLQGKNLLEFCILFKSMVWLPKWPKGFWHCVIEVCESHGYSLGLIKALKSTFEGSISWQFSSSAKNYFEMIICPLQVYFDHVDNLKSAPADINKVQELIFSHFDIEDRWIICETHILKISILRNLDLNWLSSGLSRFPLMIQCCTSFCHHPKYTSINSSYMHQSIPHL